MTLKVEISKKAYKDIKNLENSEAKQVVESIKELISFPNVPNIKKLTNFQPSYRLRVGDYRVLFEIEGELVVVYRVLHRRDSYK